MKKFYFSSRNDFICQAILIGLGAYYTICVKLVGLTMSTILSNFIKEAGVNILTVVFCGIVLYAITTKVIFIYIKLFKKNGFETIPPESISHCIMRFNSEIEQHIEQVNRAGLRFADFPDKHHSFLSNLGLIVDALATHISASMDIKRRDFFISIYYLQEDGETLTYLLHHPSNRDIIHSDEFKITDPKYEYYECVKCIKDSTRKSLGKTDCSDYVKRSKRQKKVKNYYGHQICEGNKVIGFVNIELNERIFTKNEVLVDYVEANIISYIQLIQYQFLKKRLFGMIKKEGVKNE